MRTSLSNIDASTADEIIAALGDKFAPETSVADMVCVIRTFEMDAFVQTITDPE